MASNTNSVTGNLIDALKSRPEIIGMLIVVGGFLYHMDVTNSRAIAAQERRDGREDFVANQRIDACHDIQLRGIQAIERNTDAMIMNAASDAGLTDAIDTLTITVSGNTVGLRQVQETLSDLIHEINLHSKYSQNQAKLHIGSNQ